MFVSISILSSYLNTKRLGIYIQTMTRSREQELFCVSRNFFVTMNLCQDYYLADCHELFIDRLHSHWLLLSFGIIMIKHYPYSVGFPDSLVGKESACNAGDLGWEDPLEKGKATHSSILAWRIP